MSKAKKSLVDRLHIDGLHVGDLVEISNSEDPTKKFVGYVRDYSVYNLELLNRFTRNQDGSLRRASLFKQWLYDEKITRIYLDSYTDLRVIDKYEPAQTPSTV